MVPSLRRSLLAAVTAFALVGLALGIQRTLGAVRMQGWSELGYDWLAWDLWARTLLWKEAALAGVVVLAGVFVFERARRRGWEKGARLAPAIGFLAQPLFALIALFAWFTLPRVVAQLTQPDAPGGAPNVLVVLVDTWRADHTGFLGYERDVSPNLDRLAERGAVFEHAVAQSGWTKPSVATLFTGQIPSKHRAVSQPIQGLSVRGTQLLPGTTSFLETFRALGWDTGVWSNNPNILPVRGFDQGAAHFVDYFYHPDRTPEFDPGRAERMLPDVSRWLAEERDAARPFCAYVHIMDPHYPYVAPEPFAGKFDTSGMDFNLVGPVVDDYMEGKRDLSEVTPEMLQRIIDIYDEELLYVDHYLGPFLEDVLREHPDTIVVVLGDHGEEFLEHGQFGHGHSIYEELVHVPLLLWGPQVEPTRVASQVRLMDVYPTLLELAGVGSSAPPDLHGESLVPLMNGTETKHRLAPMESGGDQRPPWQWRGISDGTHKVIRREADLPTSKPVADLTGWDKDETRPYWRFFDLSADPGEQENLLPDERAAAEALFERMEAEGWYFSPEKLLLMRATKSDLGGNIDLIRDLGYAGDTDE